MLDAPTGVPKKLAGLVESAISSIKEVIPVPGRKYFATVTIDEYALVEEYMEMPMVLLERLKETYSLQNEDCYEVVKRAIQKAITLKKGE